MHSIGFSLHRQERFFFEQNVIPRSGFQESNRQISFEIGNILHSNLFNEALFPFNPLYRLESAIPLLLQRLHAMPAAEHVRT